MTSEQEVLLQEFKENREELRAMISDLESFKKQVNKLFPEKIDNRYKYFFDEKIKAITGFFNSLLDVRKEINKSLKDEIELRRRLNQDEDEYERELNIGELAAQIKSLTEPNTKFEIITNNDPGEILNVK